MKNQCERYWAYADHIPIDDVISYWCEKSGFDSGHCKSAKRAAILTACKAGAIKFGRSDGKTFNDSPDMLGGMGVLTLERKSFDAWVTESFESESPLPEKPLGTTERSTLLIIIAMACKNAGYDMTRHAKTAGILHDAALQMGISIGETTIEGYLKKIPDAVAGRTK